MNLKSKYIKLTQWEYWPTFMFYIPLIPFYITESIKSKSFTFYLNTNPTIKYSGDGTESKYKTIKMVPEEFRPKSILLNEFENITTTLVKITKAKIKFPLIAKPDLGFRGYLVKKINSEKELQNYLQKNNSIKILIQEYLNYKNECGILYYRYPNEQKGKITSITLKKFLKVKGNGISTLTELISVDKRAYLYMNLLQNIHQDKLKNIPSKNEIVILTVIGNHSKGTEFLNGNYLIDTVLEKTFDKLNKQIKGWYFGRLDIKYNDFKDLRLGKDFKILEINGIIAEPTHIYDASYKGANYAKAIITLKENWRTIFKIAKQNITNHNLSNPKFSTYFKNMIFLRQYSWKLKRLNKKA
ncbi:MAG: D-alanine--D-alanine ligase [Flavobacteriaceae bacterium]|nr:D-alanine--D-alanine ligase [Flavobacteriaceae bacterium]